MPSMTYGLSRLFCVPPRVPQKPKTSLRAADNDRAVDHRVADASLRSATNDFGARCWLRRRSWQAPQGSKRRSLRSGRRTRGPIRLLVAFHLSAKCWSPRPRCRKVLSCGRDPEPSFERARSLWSPVLGFLVAGGGNATDRTKHTDRDVAVSDQFCFNTPMAAPRREVKLPNGTPRALSCERCPAIVDRGLSSLNNRETVGYSRRQRGRIAGCPSAAWGFPGSCSERTSTSVQERSG